ncbi:DUF6262 family protein [Bacillus mycoides]|uniref:DUF6262 family protein n=1 Tax=Bacillus mycoides TaxID=1405 RepID=UPI003F7BD617
MNISERNVIIKSKHIRNTEGIKKHELLKSQKASQKGDQAIQHLIKTKTKINFNQVAMESGVSKAFLYKGSCRIAIKLKKIGHPQNEKTCEIPIDNYLILIT